MTIRTPARLGTLIRSTRKKIRLHQSTLAKKMGSERDNGLACLVGISFTGIYALHHATLSPIRDLLVLSSRLR